MKTKRFQLRRTDLLRLSNLPRSAQKDRYNCSTYYGVIEATEQRMLDILQLMNKGEDACFSYSAYPLNEGE